MCVLTICFDDYVMPLREGAKVMEMMAKAASCKYDYVSGRVQLEGQQPRVELRVISADAIDGMREVASGARAGGVRKLEKLK